MNTFDREQVSPRGSPSLLVLEGAGIIEYVEYLHTELAQNQLVSPPVSKKEDGR